MSNVTNVLLEVCISEDGVVEGEDGERDLQVRLPGFGFSEKQHLNSLSEKEAASMWGGFKYPEVVLFAAAFNFVFLDEIQEKLGAFPWKHPKCIRLLVAEQDDQAFGVYVLREGAWICVLEPEQHQVSEQPK